MKVAEAIEIVDRIKPNAFDAGDKVRWLSELDHSVFEDVIKNKEGAAGDFKAYDYGEDDDKEMLIPSPYTECYTVYLAAKIDFYNNDTLGYQNAMIMFNSLYEEFVAWYTRNHMPKQVNNIRV